MDIDNIEIYPDFEKIGETSDWIIGAARNAKEKCDVGSTPEATALQFKSKNVNSSFYMLAPLIMELEIPEKNKIIGRSVNCKPGSCCGYADIEISLSPNDSNVKNTIMFDIASEDYIENLIVVNGTALEEVYHCTLDKCSPLGRFYEEIYSLEESMMIGIMSSSAFGIVSPIQPRELRWCAGPFFTSGSMVFGYTCSTVSCELTDREVAVKGRRKFYITVGEPRKEEIHRKLKQILEGEAGLQLDFPLVLLGAGTTALVAAMIIHKLRQR